LIRKEIWLCLERLKRSGLAMIVIDKNIGPLLRLADRHYILEKGRVVWQGASPELRAQPGVLQQYVGV
jgi:branched-chain amino acid transport system ATP-binding protein